MTTYRNLTNAEITRLEQLGNFAANWQQVRVADPFVPECVRNNTFEGEVAIGSLTIARTADGDLELPEGVYNSLLRNVTLGNHPTVHNVRHLSGYTIGHNVLLFNIGEMTAAADPHAVAWLEPMNENGGRRILPFGEMTVGDAYLWARYRGRTRFVERLEQFTFDLLSSPQGRYGRVGDCCTIKNTATLRNVIVRSDATDPTRIDTCLALTDGVVGLGCRLEFGVVASRFLLGEHVHLEFGLRLNDTVVGDNSTLARCEVGNSIIFPAHEQHHNNSFLIAALVMGQSNVAAGGTIGSNHNSRTADGEISAGRGFWPGLCCSFKHSSRFASYCLLAKADYPAELDIRLPFALVNNNTALDRLEVMPAYWWLYNMYAMDRNSRKFAQRDKRVHKAQHIEFDNLAPDTAEQILAAIDLLHSWDKGESEVVAHGMEKSHRPTIILKAREGLKAYADMLLYYAMKTLVSAHDGQLPPAALGAQPRVTEWVNIGGQIVPKADIDQLIADVESGTIGSWEGVNARLDALWAAYPAQRAAHAYAIACRLEGVQTIDEARWQTLLDRYADLQAYVAAQVKLTRSKDDANPYRAMTYFDAEECAAVMA